MRMLTKLARHGFCAIALMTAFSHAATSQSMPPGEVHQSKTSPTIQNMNIFYLFDERPNKEDFRLPGGIDECLVVKAKRVRLTLVARRVGESYVPHAKMMVAIDDVGNASFLKKFGRSEFDVYLDVFGNLLDASVFNLKMNSLYGDPPGFYRVDPVNPDTLIVLHQMFPRELEPIAPPARPYYVCVYEYNGRLNMAFKAQ